MNVDSSIAKASFSSSSQATGNSQGSAAAVSGGSEGSLFQQLISRVMAANGMKKGTAGDEAGSAAQDKSDGSGGDLLAGLLSGGNLTGSGIENTTLLTPETAADAHGESSKADGTNAVMEAILALTGGLIPAQAADGGTTSGEAAADPTAALISAIGQVKTGLIGAGTLNGKDNGTAAQISGKPAFTIPNANLQQGEKANAAALTDAEIPANSGEIDLTGVGKDGLASGKTENLQAASGQKFNLSGTGTNAQPVEARNKAQEQSLDDLTMPGQNQKAGIANAAGAETQNPIGDMAAVGAAAQSPLAQMTGTAEPYSQISNEILSRAGAATELNAQMEQKGPMEFKMQLEPADLGQIDIKLSLSEGKLMIDILAANSKTHALLTSQVDKLISSMGLQNVQVESVQVSQQMNSQSQSGGQNQGYTMNSAMDFSQRSNQEQYRQEFGNSVNTTAASSLQGNDTQEAGMVSRIESLRYDSHRMNYAV